ncbi:hypothetical protein MPSEU_000199400 [Mayamaea pseudoterrestris]|nr:hypothetical protein MPSEU_000199400 [Mayamaea pseudoterrestris]
MEPFDQGYHTDSGDEATEKLQWPSSNVSASLSSRHAALMRDELEISPLVPSVPPMPGERHSSVPGPGLPSSFRAGTQSQEQRPILSPKKRHVAPDVFDKEEYSSQHAIGGARADPGEFSPETDLNKKPAAKPDADATMEPYKRSSDHLGMDIMAEAVESKRAKMDEMSGTDEQAVRPNLRDIVLGSASPSKASANTEAGTETNEHAATPEQDALVAQIFASPSVASGLPLPSKKDTESSGKKSKTPTDTEGDDKKRRRSPKAIRKVLIAKKEQEQATSLLHDKVDLTNILEQADCFFLANQFWIFTVQQVASILLPTEPNESCDRLRDELVARIVSTNYLADGSTSEAVNLYEITDAGRPAAEARVAEWKSKVEEYISSGGVATSIEESFKLSGPISCLFPKTTQNFLASVPILTLWNFLSVRKTESGAVCEMMKVWRRFCHLSTISPLSIAKHLIGITNRIESALSTIPAVSSEDMSWMSDPIIILTGAAREFLVKDQGITTARRFVDVRTKNLSTNLEIWRERKGLPALKGSGKVAMISGWKATAREAMDAEDEPGMVVTDINLEAQVARDAFIINEGGNAQYLADQDIGEIGNPVLQGGQGQSVVKAAGLDKVQDVGSADRQLKYALDAQVFLEDVLGGTITKFLASVDIKTAGELFRVSSDDPLRAKLYEHMKTRAIAKDNVECKNILKSWSDKINKELDQFRPKCKRARSKSREPKARETIDKVGAGATNMMKDSNDPFKILSSVTQAFLHTLGIETAAAFLASRTTDIADAFVHWRAESGMPVLKGQGAIASVSGWKTSCRKAASMLGMEDLAALEPASREKIGNPHKTKRENQALPTFMLSASSDGTNGRLTVEHCLGGKDTVVFAVGVDDETQCQFQLQVRRIDVSSTIALYISYCGEMGYPGPISGKCTSPSPIVSVLDPSSTEAALVDLSIMRHVPTTTNRFQRFGPFASTMPGMGLIELKRYEVRPVKSQPLESLKQELRDFVVNGTERLSQPIATSSVSANVLLHRQRSSQGFQYLLFLRSPMERGQATELRFPLVDSYMGSGVYHEYQFERRLLLEDSFQLLSVDDIHEVIEFLDKVVFPLIGSGESINLDEVQRVAEAQRRLHWAALRLHSLIESPIPVKERMGHLYFGFLEIPQMLNLPQTAMVNFPDARQSYVLEGCRAEIQKELAAILEYDSIVGLASTCRCPLAEKTAAAITDDFLLSYCHFGHYPNADDASKALVMRLEALLTNEPTLDTCILKCAGTADDNLVSVLARICETYQLSLEVSGDDIKGDAPETDVLDVVVCAPCNDGQVVNGDSRPKLQTLAKYQEAGPGLPVDFAWYQKLQWHVVYGVIMGLRSLLSSDERKLLLSDTILSDVKGVVEALTGLTQVEEPTITTSRHLRLSGKSEDQPPYEPHAFPLFLGIVWPALRNGNWRLEINDSNEIASFVAPASGRQNPSGSSRAQRTRRRNYLTRECREIGLGDLSKFTKRLFVQVCSQVSSGSDEGTKSIDEALQQFADSVVSELENDDHSGANAVKIITGALAECLKKVSPKLASFGDSSTETTSQTEKECVGSISGTDTLLRFLLVLPTLLRQCNLPLQAFHDCLDVIQNVVDFLVVSHASVLDESYWPSQEQYKKEDKPTTTGLASNIRRVRSKVEGSVPKMLSDGTGGQAGAMTEIVPEYEKNQLTTFLVRVLEQAIPCRADELDCGKRNRQIHVGYPGFVCRHCLGYYGEGKYFFTTLESLTTASSVFEKHVLKCPAVPADTKTEIITSKVDAVEERKHLPAGAQQAFFSRLWDRLRSSEIDGVSAGVHVQEIINDDVEVAAVEKNAQLTFANHLAVLNYLRTPKVIINDKTISEALTLYYNSLEYGGRVWYTPAQPEHFSAEWLIRKIAPKMAWASSSNKKARMMPG